MPRAPGTQPISQAALAFAHAPRADHVPARLEATSAPAVPPVEVGKVRAILAADRAEAGEERAEPAPIAPLQTASYTVPLGVQLRRLGRGRLRAAIALSAALLAGVAGLSVMALRGLRGGAEASDARGVERAATVAALAREEPSLEAQDTVHAEPAHVELAPAAPDHAVAAAVALSSEPPAAAPANHADAPEPQSRAPRSGELHHRFVRADALLRHPSARAAEEARALLESALPHAPRDAHGYASLAEACQRLGDQTCASDAIGEALKLRPKRSRYVALGHMIRADLAARP